MSSDQKVSSSAKTDGKKTAAREPMSSNQKLVIGTAVVLCLFLGVIFGPKAFSALAGFRAKALAQSKTTAKAAPEPLMPPLLKEADLVGSVWNVTIKGFTLKVSLNANGQAVAGSDNMLVRQLAKAKYGVESLPGKWSVDGAKLHVSTAFEGKEVSTDLTISGTKLVSKEGVPIVRVK